MPLRRMPQAKVYDPNQSVQVFLQAVKQKQETKRQSEKDKLERQMFEFQKKKFEAAENKAAQKAVADTEKEKLTTAKKKQELVAGIEKQHKAAFLENYPIDADENTKKKYIFEGMEKFGGALHATGQFEPDEIDGILNRIATKVSPEGFESQNKDYWGEEKTPAKDQLTITNVATGETQRVYPEKDADYSPPEGWVIGKPKKGMQVTLPDGTTISVGGDAELLTKPTKTMLEKDVVGLESQLADLEALGESFSKDYLTYFGGIKKWALNKLSKTGADIGEGGREFIQGARVFQEGVEQVFNAYRKEITGAQAAMKEIAMLRDSILNKELSPDEFEASFNRYVGQIKRQLALKKHFINKGITDPKELGEKIDTAVVTGQDAIDLRGNEVEAELLKQGVPENEIEQAVLKILKKEGLF